MAPNDSALIDEKGHTVADAKEQVPNLDPSAPAASEELPQGGGNVMVPAQTPEEVEAQVKNRAGTPDESHDLSDQLVEAARAESDEDEDGAADDEASEIAEANEELDPDGEGDDDDALGEDEDEDEDA